MHSGKKYGKTSGVLVTIGALNWGLVGIGGLFDKNFNVVNLILDSWPIVENIVYIIVGLAALVLLFGMKKGKASMNSAPAEGMGGPQM